MLWQKKIPMKPFLLLITFCVTTTLFSQYQMEYLTRGMYAINEGNGASLEFYVLPEVFKRDMCKGFDFRDVGKVLKQHGFIKTDEGRHTLTHRLPMLGKTRCYLVLPTIFEYECEGEVSGAAA